MESENAKKFKNLAKGSHDQERSKMERLEAWKLVFNNLFSGIEDFLNSEKIKYSRIEKMERDVSLGKYESSRIIISGYGDDEIFIRASFNGVGPSRSLSIRSGDGAAFFQYQGEGMWKGVLGTKGLLDKEKFFEVLYEIAKPNEKSV